MIQVRRLQVFTEMESSCTVSLIWGVGGTAWFGMIDFVYNLIIMGSLGGCNFYKQTGIPSVYFLFM